MVIDCTEFKFQNATNVDLSYLMFSNYKNTVTDKVLIGIVALNSADMDSIQIIHIEATQTKQINWLVSGLCEFAGFYVRTQNKDYVDSLISTIQYVKYLQLLWIFLQKINLRYGFNVASRRFSINKYN